MDAKLIVAVAIAAIAVICGVIWFIKLPNKTKIQSVKEWLKWAVIMAEKELGGGTGQLKLRRVYDMAIVKYPWIGQLVPFETFSKWVDEALDWSKKQLEQNKAIENYVKGE